MSAAPALIIPAFDPDSRDVRLLTAFEEVRAIKAWVYGFDGAPEALVPEAEIAKREEAQLAAEDMVEGEFALTIPGVIAQISLLFTHVEVERWVDCAMVNHGFSALFEHKKELDGIGQQFLELLDTLYHMEWAQALAAYEKSAADYTVILDGKALVEAEVMAGRKTPFTEMLEQHFDRAEDQFSNERELTRLMRTLTPDLVAYRRKIEILVGEGVCADAGPWLARDANFIAARLEPYELPSGDKKEVAA